MRKTITIKCYDHTTEEEAAEIVTRLKGIGIPADAISWNGFDDDVMDQALAIEEGMM